MHDGPLGRDPARPAIYQIILQGQLGGQWSDWFDGFAITQNAHGQTVLVGPVADQAALHGVLKKIRDLGIPLISVHRVDAGTLDTNE